ncbi:MAG: hypothetical protein ACREOF_09155 [Gemmatimonadales bacterium]
MPARQCPGLYPQLDLDKLCDYIKKVETWADLMVKDYTDLRKAFCEAQRIILAWDGELTDPHTHFKINKQWKACGGGPGGDPPPPPAPPKW